MPRLTTRSPRMYRDRGGAYVKLNGQRLSLGPWGTEMARENYDRAVAEWLSRGRQLPAFTPCDEPATVTEVCVAFLKHAHTRHRGGDLDHITAALRLLRRLYGRQPADELGPKRFRVVRDQMVSEHLARSTINKRMRWILRAFRWAASIELCGAQTYQRLQSVEALRRGHGGRETQKVRPVPRGDIRRVRRRLPRPVRALVDLQLLTGSRPGELLGLRPCDIDTSGKVWSVQLDGSTDALSHKTAYAGKERIIWFGPRAQRILRHFFGVDGHSQRPLFSPMQACLDAARRRGGRGRRPGQRPNARKTDRTVGDRYTTASYRRAIHAACTATGTPTWGPHRLRHNAATALRRAFGLDVAGAVLNHSSLVVTLICAEENRRKAREAIARVG